MSDKEYKIVKDEKQDLNISSVHNNIKDVDLSGTISKKPNHIIIPKENKSDSNKEEE